MQEKIYFLLKNNETLSENLRLTNVINIKAAVTNLKTESQLFKQKYEDQQKRAQTFLNKFENLNHELYKEEELAHWQEEKRLAAKKYDELYAKYSKLEEEKHNNRLGCDEKYYQEAINQLQKRINYLSKQ